MQNIQNIFIISGPAGSGKDAIIDGLEKILPITRVITTTTRKPRPGETEGRPYYFVSREAFEQGIALRQFIEHSINENNEYYGVTRKEFERVTEKGGIGIWRVDWKGTETAHRLFPRMIAIYISAPFATLEQRLRKRDAAKKDELYFRERMAYTEEWLKHLDIYDYTIENEEGKLAETVQKVSALITKLSAT